MVWKQHIKNSQKRLIIKIIIAANIYQALAMCQTLHIAANTELHMYQLIQNLQPYMMVLLFYK